jgi:hypothetical protein
MLIPPSLPKWLCLPSRIALLLGLGAFSAAGANAGTEARELTLGDTPETRRLRQLLHRDGATKESPRSLHDRLILVGGGGSGFDG